MANDNVNNRSVAMLNNFMPQQITSRICFLLIGIIFSVQSFAVDIDVSVDRNPVSINESFKLVFSATESPDDDPDFGPLDKNFQVLNQQKNSQSSWVNGQSKRRISWTLDVMAKQAGPLTIPNISFGDDTSAELKINVLAAAVNDKMSVNDDLFLQITVSPDQPYVQSQVLYTIRLFQRIQISQASLSEPTVDNVIVERIGQDSQFNTKVNGVNYSVFERKYAIFPQQSGKLNIPPIALTAQVVTGAATSRYGSLFNTQRTQTRRVQSKAIQLEVLPAPDAFSGQHWLAAENVQLQQTWSSKDLTAAVGEPLTRTITILAKGITASQLPELELTLNSSTIKMYPDQPVLKNQRAATGVTAIREQKVAIIPSKAGEYRVPAIEVPWFNTTTGLVETALIPETTITAVAKQSVEIPRVIADVSEKPTVEAQTVDPVTSVNAVGEFWKWLSVVLAIGWLLTLMWMMNKRQAKTHHLDVTENDHASMKKAMKSLHAACHANDPKQAKKALISWGYLLHNTRELDHISIYCSLPLQAEIKRLNQCIYSQGDSYWDGAELTLLVDEHTHQMQEKEKHKKKDELEPLHRL